jgi:hypothetical protein
MREVAIRLRIKLVRENIEKEVIALIKSGYETLEPEILVPSDVARDLIYNNDSLSSIFSRKL